MNKFFETVFAIVGVMVLFSGMVFWAIANSCDSQGQFKTPWWSGAETVYTCERKV